MGTLTVILKKSSNDGFMITKFFMVIFERLFFVKEIIGSSKINQYFKCH